MLSLAVISAPSLYVAHTDDSAARPTVFTVVAAGGADADYTYAVVSTHPPEMRAEQNFGINSNGELRMIGFPDTAGADAPDAAESARTVFITASDGDSTVTAALDLFVASSVEWVGDAPHQTSVRILAGAVNPVYTITHAVSGGLGDYAYQIISVDPTIRADKFTLSLTDAGVIVDVTAAIANFNRDAAVHVGVSDGVSRAVFTVNVHSISTVQLTAYADTISISPGKANYTIATLVPSGGAGDYVFSVYASRPSDAAAHYFAAAGGKVRLSAIADGGIPFAARAHHTLYVSASDAFSSATYTIAVTVFDALSFGDLPPTIVVNTSFTGDLHTIRMVGGDGDYTISITHTRQSNERTSRRLTVYAADKEFAIRTRFYHVDKVVSVYFEARSARQVSHATVRLESVGATRDERIVFSPPTPPYHYVVTLANRSFGTSPIFTLTAVSPHDSVIRLNLSHASYRNANGGNTGVYDKEDFKVTRQTVSGVTRVIVSPESGITVGEAGQYLRVDLLAFNNSADSKSARATVTVRFVALPKITSGSHATVAVGQSHYPLYTIQSAGGAAAAFDDVSAIYDAQMGTDGGTGLSLIIGGADNNQVSVQTAATAPGVASVTIHLRDPIPRFDGIIWRKTVRVEVVSAVSITSAASRLFPANFTGAVYTAQADGGFADHAYALLSTSPPNFQSDYQLAIDPASGVITNGVRFAAADIAVTLHIRAQDERDYSSATLAVALTTFGSSVAFEADRIERKIVTGKTGHILTIGATGRIGSFDYGYHIISSNPPTAAAQYTADSLAEGDQVAPNLTAPFADADAHDHTLYMRVTNGISYDELTIAVDVVSADIVRFTPAAAFVYAVNTVDAVTLRIAPAAVSPTDAAVSYQLIADEPAIALNDQLAIHIPAAQPFGGQPRLATISIVATDSDANPAGVFRLTVDVTDPLSFAGDLNARIALSEINSADSALYTLQSRGGSGRRQPYAIIGSHAPSAAQFGLRGNTLLVTAAATDLQNPNFVTVRVFDNLLTVANFYDEVITVSILPRISVAAKYLTATVIGDQRTGRIHAVHATSGWEADGYHYTIVGGAPPAIADSYTIDGNLGDLSLTAPIATGAHHTVSVRATDGYSAVTVGVSVAALPLFYGAVTAANAVYSRVSVAFYTAVAAAQFSGYSYRIVSVKPPDKAVHYGLKSATGELYLEQEFTATGERHTVYIHGEDAFGSQGVLALSVMASPAPTITWAGGNIYTEQAPDSTVTVYSTITYYYRGDSDKHIYSLRFDERQGGRNVARDRAVSPSNAELYYRFVQPRPAPLEIYRYGAAQNGAPSVVVRIRDNHDLTQVTSYLYTLVATDAHENIQSFQIVTLSIASIPMWDNRKEATYTQGTVSIAFYTVVLTGGTGNFHYSIRSQAGVTTGSRYGVDPDTGAVYATVTATLLPGVYVDRLSIRFRDLHTGFSNYKGMDITVVPPLNFALTAATKGLRVTTGNHHVLFTTTIPSGGDGGAVTWALAAAPDKYTTNYEIHTITVSSGVDHSDNKAVIASIAYPLFVPDVQPGNIRYHRVYLVAGDGYTHATVTLSIHHHVVGKLSIDFIYEDKDNPQDHAIGELPHVFRGVAVSIRNMFHGSATIRMQGNGLSHLEFRTLAIDHKDAEGIPNYLFQVRIQNVPYAAGEVWHVTIRAELPDDDPYADHPIYKNITVQFTLMTPPNASGGDYIHTSNTRTIHMFGANGFGQRGTGSNSSVVDGMDHRNFYAPPGSSLNNWREAFQDDDVAYRGAVGVSFRDELWMFGGHYDGSWSNPPAEKHNDHADHNPKRTFNLRYLYPWSQASRGKHAWSAKIPRSNGYAGFSPFRMYEHDGTRREDLERDEYCRKSGALFTKCWGVEGLRFNNGELIVHGNRMMLIGGAFAFGDPDPIFKDGKFDAIMMDRFWFTTDGSNWTRSQDPAPWKQLDHTWSEDERAGISAAALGGTLYVYIATQRSQHYSRDRDRRDEVYVFRTTVTDFREESYYDWEQVGPGSTVRAPNGVSFRNNSDASGEYNGMGAKIIAFNGRIWIVGGLGNRGRVVTYQKFDEQGRFIGWRNNNKGGRHGTAHQSMPDAVVYGDYLYLVGGNDNPDERPPDSDPMSRIYRSKDGLSWESVGNHQHPGTNRWYPHRVWQHDLVVH